MFRMEETDNKSTCASEESWSEVKQLEFDRNGPSVLSMLRFHCILKKSFLKALKVKGSFPLIYVSVKVLAKR